jgi:hypothetical protein
MMRLTADPFAFDPAGRQAMSQAMDSVLRRMERSRSEFYEPPVDFNRSWW